jgi:hypothetical protein
VPTTPKNKKIQAATLTATLEHFKKNIYLRINSSLPAGRQAYFFILL